jgi:hypothetical protein
VDGERHAVYRQPLAGSDRDTLGAVRAASTPKEVGSDRYSGQMIGDMVEVIVDAGTGSARTFEIAATRAGRRVEVTTARGVVEVAELTRTGQPVRVGRFMAARVIAIVEHPASDGAIGAERRRSTRVEQEETLL